jgi:S-adenosylmethionine decarboxylase
MSNENNNIYPTDSPIVELKKSHSFSNIKETNHKLSNQDAQALGKHFIIDFWGADFLDDVEFIETALVNAADAANAILLHIHIHKFLEGGGVTGVALLAESHISIHTWPESDYAAFDVFMCGDSYADKAVKYLQEAFKPKRLEVHELSRGSLK